MSDDDERSATVLVADNDRDNLCLLSSILRLKGFDVLAAEDGKMAVEVATRWRPELILIELSLPVISGFTAIKRVRALSSMRETPIIGFSLPEPASIQSLALAAGCTAHLEKPIDFDELDALLDQYLPGRRWELVSALVH